MDRKREYGMNRRERHDVKCRMGGGKEEWCTPCGREEEEEEDK